MTKRLRYWQVTLYLCYVIFLLLFLFLKLNKNPNDYTNIWYMGTFFRNYSITKTRLLFYLGNFALFFPLGFFTYHAFEAELKIQKVIYSLGYCFMFSLLVESIQFNLPHRIADVDDLFFNIIGGTFAVLITNFICNIQEKNFCKSQYFIA